MTAENGTPQITGRIVTLHAELLLHAPFPTIEHETLDMGITREEAQQQLIEKYGISKYGEDPDHGELASIRFYETTTIQMDGTVFVSEPKYDNNVINLYEFEDATPTEPEAAGYLSPNACIPPLRDSDTFMNAIQVSPDSWHFRFIKKFLKGTFTSAGSYAEFRNMKNIGMPSNSCQYAGWFGKALMHATIRGAERGMLFAILALCVALVAYMVVAGIYATLRQLGLTPLMWNDMYEIGLIVQLIFAIFAGFLVIFFMYSAGRRKLLSWVNNQSVREPESISTLGRFWAAKRDKICVPVKLKK